MASMTLGPTTVILYSGEPLSHHIEMAYLNTWTIHVQNVNPLYLNDPVLHLSHTGYQTKGRSL